MTPQTLRSSNCLKVLHAPLNLMKVCALLIELPLASLYWLGLGLLLGTAAIVWSLFTVVKTDTQAGNEKPRLSPLFAEAIADTGCGNWHA